ncbi:MAG: T9SS C-terminal target domain-containing protein [Calditrichaeota bacterium]|nr:MAG: T9SS C-terminal target domain-containing protein [Calditrichota bacterium]
MHLLRKRKEVPEGAFILHQILFHKTRKCVMKKIALVLSIILCTFIFVTPAFSQILVTDGSDADWADVAGVEWVDNVDGLFPAEVGAVVTDIVDIKEAKAIVVENQIFSFIRFQSGPAWPNNAGNDNKDGVDYPYSRGYYKMLFDFDNDVTTGWNVGWFEAHYTPVGYLESQNVEGAEPIGAEVMLEWGSRYRSAYDDGNNTPGEVRNVSYWAADYSEYNGQADTGSEYEILNQDVANPDSSKAFAWNGSLKINSSDDAALVEDQMHSYWAGHSWGDDYLEFGMEITPLIKYYQNKDGSSVLQPGDVVGFCGMVETPMDDWGVDISSRGEFTVPERTARPMDMTFDGDNSDWSSIAGVDAVDNVDGLFPAEVGAVVTDKVDIKHVKAFATTDALYYMLQFHAGPAWPNNAASSNKDGVDYPYSRGYYKLLVDTDNDATTGWNVGWYEAHYTPVGYLESQNVAGADPVGAEMMVEWGARFRPEYDGGTVRNHDYWAADYSEYNGQADTGSEYDMFNYFVVDSDTSLTMAHDGLLLNDPSIDDGIADWMAHAWGDDFIEVGIGLRASKNYFANKDGSVIFSEGDAVGYAGMTETPQDDWGVDITSRGEFTVAGGGSGGTGGGTTNPILVTDGSDADWADVAGVEWVDNVDGLFPAEVGAVVTDIVDIKEAKAIVVENQIFSFIRFQSGPAWPNNAGNDNKDGVDYPYSRGYYKMLFDFDNDVTTGWNVGWFEAHYTPVGYLESQNVEGAEPIGAEVMLEWGSRYRSAYDDGNNTPGEVRNVSYWAADYSEYNGQADTGSEYEILNQDVANPDSSKAFAWNGSLKINSSDDAALVEDQMHSYWAGHSWGDDYLEFGMEITPLIKYYQNKDGSSVLQPGDVVGFCGMVETPMDDWGVDISSRGEFTVPERTARPMDMTFDGDNSDWSSIAGVDAVDNVDGLFPAEVGAVVTDKVDIKHVKAFATTDALYYMLQFHAGPAWPNNAASSNKDGVDYPYSRGYYKLLVDTDNDATTGWNVGWYEAHYTPVGYLESQNVAGADPVGAEMMVEWGARFRPEYDGGTVRNHDYWAADYSEYNGQADTGSEYDMFNYFVVDSDTSLTMAHDGLLLNDPSIDDGIADWMAHAWGDDFIEVGIGLRASKNYFANKDGSVIFSEGDAVGYAGMTETPQDDWGVDITSRGEFTVIATGTAVQEDIPVGIADTYKLGHNYPNPFNPETTIDFTIAQTGQTQIVIYNVLGQRVHTLVDGVVQSGTHSVKWNGRNAFGVSVPSGVYYYTLKSNSFKQTKKMLLLK